MPDVRERGAAVERNVDICVISRAAKVKRIVETLEIVRGLLNSNPQLKVTLIVPDHRHFSEGERTYQLRDIDRRFFDLPLRMFSGQELKNLSFICTSEESFGRFPLSTGLMVDLLRRSKLMLLTSHLEGTPRVIAEALMTGTPCVLSKELRTGIRSHLNPQNTLFVDDDIGTAVGQIAEALANLDRFHVDVEEMHRMYCETEHIGPLRERLSRLLTDAGSAVDGEWFLDELHLRLACHGQKHNSQFMHNETLFFDWLDKVQRFSPYDEDRVLGVEPLDDTPPFSPSRLARKAAGRIYRRFFFKPS
jgi:hypothetical protein